MLKSIALVTFLIAMFISTVFSSNFVSEAVTKKERIFCQAWLGISISLLVGGIIGLIILIKTNKRLETDKIPEHKYAVIYQSDGCRYHDETDEITFYDTGYVYYEVDGKEHYIRSDGIRIIEQ